MGKWVLLIGIILFLMWFTYKPWDNSLNGVTDNNSDSVNKRRNAGRFEPTGYFKM